MAHVRTQLRLQAVDELKAITVFDAKVYSTRVDPFKREDMPVCNVLFAGEDSEPMVMGPRGDRIINRSMSLSVEVYMSGITDIDDAIDDLCMEVEQILGNSTLANLAADVALTNTIVNFDGQGEQRVGVAVMTWTIIYRTLEGDPQTSV